MNRGIVRNISHFSRFLSRDEEAARHRRVDSPDEIERETDSERKSEIVSPGCNVFHLRLERLLFRESHFLLTY